MLALAALLPLEAQAADDEVTVYKRAVEKRFAAWLEALWPDVEAAGVSRKTFEANLKGLKLDWSLPQLVLPNPAAPDGPALPEALVAETDASARVRRAGQLFQQEHAQRARHAPDAAR